MYNMEINLFGFKMNLELLILMGVIYLILVAHTIGGSCNMPLIMEGNTTMRSSGSGISARKIRDNIKNTVENNIPKPAANSPTEGFTGSNINFGESSEYSLGDYSIPDTSKWGQPNLTVTPGQPVPEAVTKFMARKEQPIPLPEGEMLMFANTPFKPECCPSTYSNSSGCACLTTGQYGYLQNRGGNNIPYSEY